MQLGELQHQIGRFTDRGVSVIALSVDEPMASLAMIRRLGLRFDLASDPDQAIVRAFHVQNPDTRELALHAVYIIDPNGKVFFRKVGRRRPVSAELIDAIDAWRGEYPRTDEKIAPRRRSAVAFPRNNYQTLLALSIVGPRPDTVPSEGLLGVQILIEQGRSDDALIAFRRLMDSASHAVEGELIDTATWLVRDIFLADTPAAIDAGKDLNRRLRRVSELETQMNTADSDDDRDALQQTLAGARARLSRARAEIDRHAAEWNLRYAKTTLRSFSEVARATARKTAASAP
ncbi:MAG: redoxin domain-containing protein [Pseudomonadales bacterium]|nr:redoxin domain-containing protein [Pseudomonadales bacterium]MDP6472809.1 redoxin domain-containing protein [Pseudomonadales bacterium]MDP6828025.1 redoxin domain-containing protein [Pseudomonadales bacterium]MDP6970575.1 redoxin domain-containing protein [Pseudomonadales bacterium]